jgi:hypothetical protein
MTFSESAFLPEHYHIQILHALHDAKDAGVSTDSILLRNERKPPETVFVVALT